MNNCIIQINCKAMMLYRYVLQNLFPYNLNPYLLITAWLTVHDTVHNKTFEGENFCGFSLTLNVLTQKFSYFIIRTLKQMVMGKLWKFSLRNEYCWRTVKVSSSNVLLYMVATNATSHDANLSHIARLSPHSCW